MFSISYKVKMVFAKLLMLSLGTPNPKKKTNLTDDGRRDLAEVCDHWE